MRRCPSSRVPLRGPRDVARDARLRPCRLSRLLIAGNGRRILVYRPWTAIEGIELVELDLPVVARIASVLVIVLQALVLDERLLGRVLLLAFISDLLVFLRNFARLQLVHFLLKVLSCLSFILTLRIQLPLQHLSMRELVRILGDVVIPTRPGLHLLC